MVVTGTLGPYKSKTRLTVADGLEQLGAELKRLGAEEVIVSTNIELTLSGLPRSGKAEPSDRGVAVYFRLKKQDCVLACDRWSRVADNLTAIAKHIEALRGQERWGVGTLEQSFKGYAALPAPETKWWEVLQCQPNADYPIISAQYTKLARNCHPDRGGSVDKMADLNVAMEAARKAVGMR